MLHIQNIRKMINQEIIATYKELLSFLIPLNKLEGNVVIYLYNILQYIEGKEELSLTNDTTLFLKVLSCSLKNFNECRLVTSLFCVWDSLFHHYGVSRNVMEKTDVRCIETILQCDDENVYEIIWNTKRLLDGNVEKLEDTGNVWTMLAKNGKMEEMEYLARHCRKMQTSLKSEDIAEILERKNWTKILLPCLILEEEVNYVDEINEEKLEEQEGSLYAATEDGTAQEEHNAEKDEIYCQDDDDWYTKEPKPLRIEHVEKIMKERVKTGKSGPLADDTKNEGWKVSARQYFKHISQYTDEGILSMTKLPNVIETIVETKSKKKDGSHNNSAETHISAFKSLLKHMSEEEKREYFTSKAKYEDLVHLMAEKGLVLAEKRNKVYDEQLLTEQEKQKMAIVGEWEDIENAAKIYVNNHGVPETINTLEEQDLVENLALIMLYILEHPPRRLEFLTLSRVQGPLKNFIKEKQIFLNVYKTSKVYGQYFLSISDYTQSLLTLLRPGSEYIFGTEEEVLRDGWASARLQRAMKDVLGIAISCNMLRKLYIMGKTDKGELKWSKERTELARQMGHSVGEQQRVYTKKTETEETRGLKRQRCEEEPNCKI
jgi:hypothetical protein